MCDFSNLAGQFEVIADGKAYLGFHLELDKDCIELAVGREWVDNVHVDGAAKDCLGVVTTWYFDLLLAFDKLGDDVTLCPRAKGLCKAFDVVIDSITSHLFCDIKPLEVKRRINQ